MEPARPHAAVEGGPGPAPSHGSPSDAGPATPAGLARPLPGCNLGLPRRTQRRSRRDPGGV